MRASWAVAVVCCALWVGGCGDPDPDIPTISAEWGGPDFNAARPLPGDTKLMIASHRTKGQENYSEALFSLDSANSSGRSDMVRRKIGIREKVLFQGKTMPTRMGTYIQTPFPMDMTEIQEGDYKYYHKTTLPNGRTEIDTSPNGGVVSFGANDVQILSGGLLPADGPATGAPAKGSVNEQRSGFTTLALDTRRYPVARMEGPGVDPVAFRIDGDRLHYLLPHFPPTSGESHGLFPAGGVWRTKVPVYFPLTSLDPTMVDACRFMVTISHTLEGYRQGESQILARVRYSIEGTFDSQEPETAKRFPKDWSTVHVIRNTLVGEGMAIIDVGHGEILWKHESAELVLKEAHLVPPDPAKPPVAGEEGGRWEKSEKTIKTDFLMRREFPKMIKPPVLN